MFHELLASGSLALGKRAFVSGPPDERHAELPGWALAVICLNFIVFIPLIIYTSYTLATVYPVLAIVENQDPPAYEPVALNEDADGNATGPASTTIAGGPGPITSSLRSIDRLLRSVGGWRGNFRGLACAFALTIATGFVGGIFQALPLVPGALGTLLATLALVQLSTAWVHIVMSPPHAAPFWRRLPPFGRTFAATWQPILVMWLATTLATTVPTLLAAATNLPMWNPTKPDEVPRYDTEDSWKFIVIFFVSLAIWAFAIVPAKVLLVRVQASLLPPDEDSIVPFDRSFGGTIEPAVVSGKGYVTFKDAWKTFPREAWRRIYILYAKIFAVTFVIYMIMAAILVPEVMLMSKTVEKVGE